MEIIFMDCGDDVGEFRTEGYSWTSDCTFSEEPAKDSGAEMRMNLISAIAGLDGVIGVSFESDVIRVSKSEVPWEDLRPWVEGTINACLVLEDKARAAKVAATLARFQEGGTVSRENIEDAILFFQELHQAKFYPKPELTISNRYVM